MTRGFIMKPGTLARGEQLILRELKLLEYQIKSKQIDGPEAERRGHRALDKHYELIIRDVEGEAREHELGIVNQEDEEIQERLSKAKKDWSRIVEDLLAL